MQQASSTAGRLARLAMPSRSALLADLARAHASVLAGRPVVAPAVMSALAPFAAGNAVSNGHPLVQVMGKRNFSMAMRFAGYLTRRADPETLRRLEKVANREPGNVTAQMFYLQALHNSGFGEEVVARVESGTFAVTWGILELYSRCLADSRRVSEAEAGEVKHRLRQLWAAIAGSPDSAAATTIPAEQLRAVVYGGGGYGGQSAPSASSYGSSAAYSGYSNSNSSSGGSGMFMRNEDPYYGSSSASSGASSGGPPGSVALGSIWGDGVSPSRGGGGGGGGGGGAIPLPISGATGAGAPGSRVNPLVVEMQQGRAGFFQGFMRLLSMAAMFAILYQLFSRGGMPSTLAGLTGDIAEEVTEIPTTRFADVKGVDEAKAELQDVVAFLRDPEKFKRLGAKVPRGVLLTGPPGTGKTLLARAVAGEAGCKFYSKSASEFEEMLVGLGAKRVRDLFTAARKNAPAIIFIDEIDALGGRRKVSIGGGSERQTLNQLLSSMDGFTKSENVIVIAATNAPDILDAALTRPGRFDSTVDVPLPDVRGRKDIIDLYLSKVVVSKSIDAELLAKATPGFSGAQLEALVNSAALMAANRGADQIEMMDIEEARDKLIMGPAKKSRVRKEEVLRLTAYHEGGHTLTAMLTKGADSLHKVTILPRGFSGGATYSLPKDDEMATKESILAQIDVAMGGRAAEELVYGPNKITTGAGMDMSQASDLARRFCSMYSMSDLGLSSYANTEPSADRKANIDAEVEKILRQSYVRVLAMLTEHRTELDRLAAALLEHETLTAEECTTVVSGKQLPAGRDKLTSFKGRSRDSSDASDASAAGGAGGAGGSSSAAKGKDGKDKGLGVPKPKVGLWAAVTGGLLGSSSGSGSGEAAADGSGAEGSGTQARDAAAVSKPEVAVKQEVPLAVNTLPAAQALTREQEADGKAHHGSHGHGSHGASTSNSSGRTGAADSTGPRKSSGWV